MAVASYEYRYSTDEDLLEQAATATFFQTTTGVPAASDAVTFLGDAWTFLGDPITFTPPAGLFGP
jgi:hypothetical protein